MKKRLISAWLALRGIIDYESVAQAQAAAKAEEEITRRIAIMLRDQDQELWKMSQQPTWDRMRPIFAAMMEQVNARKITENKRIVDLIIPEIESTYGKRMAQEESDKNLRMLRG